MKANKLLEKAKGFATEMTTFNTKAKILCSEKEIFAEHVSNKKAVSKTLVLRGILAETAIG